MSIGLDGVKDLRAELADHGRGFVRALVRVVWICLYEARIREALELLDSDGVRRIGEHLGPSDRARLKLARAQAMQVRTMLVRKGHEDALAIVDRVAHDAEKLEDKRLLADAKCLESWLRINLELGVGNPSDPVLVPIETCLKLRRELGDERGIAEALFLLGLARENAAGATDATVDEAMTTYRESYRLASEAGDRRIQSYNAYHIGSIRGRRDELEEALVHMEEAYDLRAAIGMKVFLPGPCLAIGRLCLAKGDLEAAESYCLETLRLAEENGHHAFRFYALMVLGDVAAARGQTKEARGFFEQASDLGRKLERQTFVDRAAAAIEGLDS
ncbi:MAG: tetratricopeptide repeat protein [Candidatus Bipolaricaulota bacterium]|nr:MAG: tetratricopeptide repeat protein [Candidatus Bipolaricaulota bacterium]